MDPDRARLNSIATQVTNLTKPGAHNKRDLCTPSLPPSLSLGRPLAPESLARWTVTPRSGMRQTLLPNDPRPDPVDAILVTKLCLKRTARIVRVLRWPNLPNLNYGPSINDVTYERGGGGLSKT